MFIQIPIRLHNIFDLWNIMYIRSFRYAIRHADTILNVNVPIRQMYASWIPGVPVVLLYSELY